MKIGELDSEGNFKLLDSYRKIAVLGHDTFTHGKLTFASVEKVCHILKNFKKSMKDYHVQIHKAMTTSAIREASNKDYILDQIKINTGLNIEVIDNSQEQYLTHKAIKKSLVDFEQIIEEGAVVAVIGAGSIQITLYDESKLISSQNIKLGALRIREVLSSLERETTKYYQILEEYIIASIEDLDFFKKTSNYTHFIAVGGEISIINRIINSDDDKAVNLIGRQDFEDLYESLLNKSTDEIVTEYDIEDERAEILLPSIVLYKKFLDYANTDKIIVPQITLTDGIIIDIFEEQNISKKKEPSVREIIDSVEMIAKKYHYNNQLNLQVENSALFIFDKTKTLHGLKTERLFLQLACILYDIGKYISIDKYQIHSYYIIRSLAVFGMSKEQMEIIANIVRYHTMDIPSFNDENYKNLSKNERVIVAKCAAIIRLAVAIDRSHHKKIEITSVRRKNKQVIIKGKSTENTLLEQWTFKKKADFFREVFGLYPVLNIKREL